MREQHNQPFFCLQMLAAFCCVFGFWELLSPRWVSSHCTSSVLVYLCAGKGMRSVFGSMSADNPSILLLCLFWALGSLVWCDDHQQQAVDAS